MASVQAIRPSSGFRELAFHIGFALAAFMVLALVQFNIFTDTALRAQRGAGLLEGLFVIAAGLVLLFTLTSLVRQGLLMTFAFGGALRSERRGHAERSHWPGACVLVPAYNEAARIEKAIESILAVDYPDLHVVVIDDGSSDDTFARASAYAGLQSGKRVRVLTKKNGGKWSALNLGFRETSEELVVCVDADSQLAPDSLKLLVRHFDDPRLGGCCGQVAVRNCSNIITRLQALEYHLLNGLVRQAQSAFGSVLVAPGPLSVFRRSVLDEVSQTWGGEGGPWEGDTFAEDADLTLNVLLTGHGVTYEPLAISRTAAPDVTFRLLNQRYRWTRGNLQAVLKAWRRWQEARNPPRMFPVWIGIFLFESIVWPGINLIGLLAFMGVAVVFGTQPSLLIWFLVLIVIDLNEAAFSAKLERADLRLLTVAPIGRLYYGVILDVGKLFSLLDEVRAKQMRWS